MAYPQRENNGKSLRIYSARNELTLSQPSRKPEVTYKREDDIPISRFSTLTPKETETASDTCIGTGFDSSASDDTRRHCIPLSKFSTWRVKAHEDDADASSFSTEVSERFTDTGFSGSILEDKDERISISRRLESLKERCSVHPDNVPHQTLSPSTTNGSLGSSSAIISKQPNNGYTTVQQSTSQGTMSEHPVPQASARASHQAGSDQLDGPSSEAPTSNPLCKHATFGDDLICLECITTITRSPPEESKSPSRPANPHVHTVWINGKLHVEPKGISPKGKQRARLYRRAGTSPSPLPRPRGQREAEIVGPYRKAAVWEFTARSFRKGVEAKKIERDEKMKKLAKKPLPGGDF